jgi:hypothetical protein
VASDQGGSRPGGPGNPAQMLYVTRAAADQVRVATRRAAFQSPIDGPARGPPPARTGEAAAGRQATRHAAGTSAPPGLSGPVPGERAERQPHFELVALVKLLTELTTFFASVATVAICAADTFDDSPLTAPSSAWTDDVTALVWLGKSLLAELPSAAASLWIFLRFASRPLIPLLGVGLVRPLTEFWRLVRSVQ